MRRPIAMVGVTLGTLLIPVVAPVALVVAAVVDAITRTPRMRRTRVVALIAGLVFIDFVGMILVGTIWLTSPFGWRSMRPVIQDRYQWGMTWWTNKVTNVISWAGSLPIDRSQLDLELLAGNAIVIGRHRSLLDATLPAAVLGDLGYHCLYVLKDDLQWDINIDMVGHLSLIHISEPTRPY